MPVTLTNLLYYWNPKANPGAAALTNQAPGGPAASTSILATTVNASGELILSGGKTQYMTIPHRTEFTSRTSWTMEYVYTPTVLMSAAEHKLWEAEDANAAADDAFMAVSRTASVGTLICEVYNASEVSITLSPSVPELLTVQRIHIMVVFDSVAGTVTVFVNGSQKSQTTVVPVSLKAGTTTPFLVNESSSSIALKVEAFRFYNKALTSAERSANFANGAEIGIVTEVPKVKIAELRVAGGTNIPIYSIVDHPTEALRVKMAEGIGFIPLVLVTDPLASRIRLQTTKGLRALKK